MHRSICLLSLMSFASSLFAQTDPTVALRDNTPTVHAFTNVRIVTAPGSFIASGTVVIRKGVVEAVGATVAIPPDARVWNLQGRTLYPGFIDLASTYGMPQPAAGRGAPGSTPEPTATGPLSWNQKTFSHVNGADEFRPDPKTAEKLRSQGFVAVLTRPTQGIFRGTSALVTVGDGAAREVVIRSSVSQHVSLSQTGSFLSGYPNSLMGTIAHVRQTFSDADWYRRAWEAYEKDPSLSRPETNASLEALLGAARGTQPVVIDASDELNLLRAARIQKEFGLKGWINGSGSEFRRLDAVAATKLPVVVPLNFPEAPAVQSPEEALAVTLEDMRMWDAAPENPARLVKAGAVIALTSEQLKDAGSFLAQARKSVERGLSPDAALAALTSTPARLLGMERRLGTIAKGASASFVITDGDMFGEKTKIEEVWIDGKRYEVKPPPDVDVRGTWSMTVSADAGQTGTLTLKGEIDKPSGSVIWRGKELTAGNLTYSSDRITFTVPGDSLNLPGLMRMSGTVIGTEIRGTGERGDGMPFSWSATRSKPFASELDTLKPKKPEMASFADVFPLGAYGRPALPEQSSNVLITNATVWTMGKQGRIENADVLVSKGKIASIGKGLKAPAGAVTIDGTGKHVTPGLIDAHSHTAVSGSVNEGGQAITCEVRIADVIDPDDIWIYRQLAGGTTMANVLHGSANPIGGQNAVLKWRWGSLPDDLVMREAPAGVKFALGENVKRSHFTQPGQPPRFPRTRMGVEQLIRDRFQAAKEYERAWKNWEKSKKGTPPRRDLELDALVEIVNGTRLIHAHSYRQDEIVALIRVAEEFGIRIATLQHILEGYKVADVIAKHGAGASGFSDWWSYKWEAYEAIPGALPLMHKQGVLISYNSDDSQLATRLNWEASKGIEFGLSEEEVLAAVTINPARQLRIDKYVGSLEAGKDADIAVWSGNPLSTSSKCVQTWVDGRRMFDIDEDLALQKQAGSERATLIQKILKEKKSGPSPRGAPPTLRRPNEVYLQSCSSEENDHE